LPHSPHARSHPRRSLWRGLHCLHVAHGAVRLDAGRRRDEPSGIFFDRGRIPAALTPEDAFDAASCERQDEGAKAYHYPVGGQTMQAVGQPFNAPDGGAIAGKICQDLQQKGMYADIEGKFPSIAKTDNHDFALTVNPSTCAQGLRFWIYFTFSWAGHIRQGEPRKIANYAQQMILAEVKAHFPDASDGDIAWQDSHDAEEGAIISDLPNEPDTAQGQTRLFHGQVPLIFLHPPASVLAPLPEVPARFAQAN
jgi:hypothetical protein